MPTRSSIQRPASLRESTNLLAKPKNPQGKQGTQAALAHIVDLTNQSRKMASTAKNAPGGKKTQGILIGLDKIGNPNAQDSGAPQSNQRDEAKKTCNTTLERR
jgi:hypothetical protein